MIGHFPFGTGEVVALYVFDINIVVFIFGCVGCRRRRVLSVPLGALELVRLGVFRQVIRSHEALVTDRAGEPLFARVGSQVSLQFVGAREALAAKEPLAAEGPFSGVPTQVRLQMRRFTVDFTAARNVTQMLFLLVLMPSCSVCRVL